MTPTGSWLVYGNACTPYTFQFSTRRREGFAPFYLFLPDDGDIEDVYGNVSELGWERLGKAGKGVPEDLRKIGCDRSATIDEQMHRAGRLPALFVSMGYSLDLTGYNIGKRNAGT
jgi:hypothetical protein